MTGLALVLPMELNTCDWGAESKVQQRVGGIARDNDIHRKQNVLQRRGNGPSRTKTHLFLHQNSFE